VLTGVPTDCLKLLGVTVFDEGCLFKAVLEVEQLLRFQVYKAVTPTTVLSVRKDEPQY
jgi:hypothetical protein